MIFNLGDSVIVRGNAFHSLIVKGIKLSYKELVLVNGG
jgi:hypothetical protein